MLGSNLNHEQDDQDTVHGSRTHNENNMTCDFPSLYMTQSTTLTNYCMCTCCYKIDIPRSQCIIFKESKYNFGNAVAQEALSNRVSIPTSKEYICRKCDKDLLGEIMPTNSVASWIRLNSNEPQQKCIYCNSVPTDRFLTFHKTKYGENTIVNWMTENDEQNIICNKCHNAIFRESLVTWLTCDKIMKKCIHRNLIWTNTPHWKTKHEKCWTQTKWTVIYAWAATYNSNQNVYVCVATQMYIKIYVKCTTK